MTSPGLAPGSVWLLGEWLDHKGRWRNYRITPTCEPDRRLLELGYRAWRAEQSDSTGSAP